MRHGTHTEAALRPGPTPAAVWAAGGAARQARPHQWEGLGALHCHSAQKIASKTHERMPVPVIALPRKGSFFYCPKHAPRVASCCTLQGRALHSPHTQTEPQAKAHTAKQKTHHGTRRAVNTGSPLWRPVRRILALARCTRAMRSRPGSSSATVKWRKASIRAGCAATGVPALAYCAPPDAASGVAREAPSPRRPCRMSLP